MKRKEKAIQETTKQMGVPESEWNSGPANDANEREYDAYDFCGANYLSLFEDRDDEGEWWHRVLEECGDQYAPDESGAAPAHHH